MGSVTLGAKWEHTLDRMSVHYRSEESWKEKMHMSMNSTLTHTTQWKEAKTSDVLPILGSSKCISLAATFRTNLKVSQCWIYVIIIFPESNKYY